MGKKQFKLRKFIEAAIDDDNYVQWNSAAKNLDKFCRLLIDELLFYIRELPFRKIINDYLLLNVDYRGQLRAHSLIWRYTGDLQVIKGWQTYSFRFPNICSDVLYNIFNVRTDLFQKSTKWRHRSNNWYVYSGKQLLKYIGEYLSIQKIVRVEDTPITKLFVNPEEKRMDIYFYLKSIRTKITVTFEPGTPFRTESII